MSACKYCGKEVAQKKNCFGFYCSNACQAKFKSHQVFKTFLADQSPATLFDKGGQVRRGIRKWLIASAGEKCELCGWDKKRPGCDISPLEIDHVDGDWTNCNLTNLRVLCPNCHSLTATYKGANRGKGREKRRTILAATNGYQPAGNRSQSP